MFLADGDWIILESQIRYETFHQNCCHRRGQQIGYSLLPSNRFRRSSSDRDQPVELHLIEIPPALKPLEGVVMELHDCAFPLLHKVIATVELDEGFRTM